MDCRGFRKQHLAYLDDTLPGDVMAEAQRHIMTCDGCAAHDTLVRRSLMLVHNVSTIQPSAEFRERLLSRLDAERMEIVRDRWRETDAHAMPRWRGLIGRPVTVGAMALGVLVGGSVIWRKVAPQEQVVMAMQPVLVTQPAVDSVVEPVPYLSPGMMQAMATGNPVWPAALLVDDTPTQMVNAEFSLVKATRE